MMALPPGFRFHPTDEELVAYYLKRKVAGRNIEFNIITEIDLYKQEPWDLPEKSFLPSNDMEWYFFSPRDKKYPNGLRTNRATEAGYWKATGKDRNVKKAGKVVGMKKTLVFYRGRAPHGERTDWVMHEYRLDEEECEKVQASQDLFVLCRVFKKSGVGPRSGEDRGPQTYVDDDTDKEPSGSFAEAVKKALEPEAVPTPAVEAAPVETPKVAPVENVPILAAVEAAQVQAPKVGPVQNVPIPTASLSVDYYTLGEEAEDAVDMLPLGDYILEDNFTQNADGPFWDCLPAISSELEFNPEFPPSVPDGSIEQLSSSELFEPWQEDKEPDYPSGMMWNSDLSSITPQQQEQQRRDESNGGLTYWEIFESDDDLPPLLEERESDDVLPPVVEERESSSPPNGSVGRVNVPDVGEKFTETDSNEHEYQQRMSDTNFRVSEVPSHAREDNSTSFDVTWLAPSGSTSSNFDTNQQASSSGLASSASAAGSDIGEDDLFSFQDSLYDFAIDDELMNAASYVDDYDFSSAAHDELVGDQESSEVTRPPPQPDKSVKYSQCVNSESVKYSQCVNSEGPAKSSRPEGTSEKSRPSSRPSAGLIKLLGFLPALPASAAECPPDMKPVQANVEVASTFSSIHLSAVTVTCTSSADGAQKVQAAVTDCCLQGNAQSVYQQVVSSSWQTVPEGQKPVCANCDTTVAGDSVQRRVTRGSNSGFVFVFVLGAVSALCWFLLIRGMWRLASHVFTSVF